MSDQVPANSRRAALKSVGVAPEFFDLRLCFLHAVLAELAETGCRGLSDETQRGHLAYGDESYLARVAVGARGARLYATSHCAGTRAQTRRILHRFRLHCCDSVADGIEYNKRPRTPATVSPRCVRVSGFNHTISYGSG